MDAVKLALGTLGIGPSQSKTFDKSKYLRAFRTITSMLALIQSPASRNSTEAGPIATGGRDCKELRVLDSLSAVLVRCDEIIAAVARPYDGSGLEVFVSVIHPSIAQPLLQSGVVSNPSTLWGALYNFTVAMNPRTDEVNGKNDSLMNTGLYPLIGDYKDQIPKDLVSAAEKNESVLDIFLKSYW